MPSPKLPSSDGHRRSSDGSRTALLDLDGDPTTTDLAPEGSRPSNGRRRSADRTEQPDVLLDTLVNVQEIKLDVQGLRANVRVLAEVAGLVKLRVGADVRLDRVTLTVTGVEVKALLEVRLDEVRAILDRALTSLIEHPEILEILAMTVTGVVEEVEKVVSPVVEGVVSGVVTPVVQGVVGQLVAPVVEGVVRGLDPPAPGGAGPVAGPPVVQAADPPPPAPGFTGDVAGPPVVQAADPPPPAPGLAGDVAGPPVVQAADPPPPAPGGAGSVAGPPVAQPADPPVGPVTDHSGPFLEETLDEAGQAPPLDPAVGAYGDGVLERAIRLLSLLDKVSTLEKGKR